MKRDELFRNTVIKWGVDAQLLMLIEEMAELTTVILHSRRENKRVEKEELISEVADVSIMLEQIIFMFKISDEVEKMKEEKLLRLQKMLEER